MAGSPRCEPATMRLSQFHLRTDQGNPRRRRAGQPPADAASAGMIRKLAAGLYTWSPLGLRVLRKVEAVVREEMNRAGAIELLMPTIQPRELWEETGRWQKFGGQLLKIKDRKEAEYCYAPTAEEVDHRFRPPGAGQLQAAAGQLLPDPDQVPRRDPPALRGDARARIPDEGRVFVPPDRCRPGRRIPQHARHLHPHLHPPGPGVPRGAGRLRRDRRRRLAGIPRAGRFGRGRDRLLHRFRLRRQPGKGAGRIAWRAPRRRPKPCARSTRRRRRPARTSPRCWASRCSARSSRSR